jgi:hypothetical protein
MKGAKISIIHRPKDFFICFFLAKDFLKFENWSFFHWTNFLRMKSATKIRIIVSMIVLSAIAVQAHPETKKSFRSLNSILLVSETFMDTVFNT